MNKATKMANTAATDLFTAGLRNIVGLGPIHATTLKAWPAIGAEALKFRALRM